MVASRPSWLFPDADDRQLFYELAPWLKRARTIAGLLLAGALALTPGVEAWIFLVLAWWAAVWQVADRAGGWGWRAELWATWASLNSIAGVAIVIAATGGATSPFRYFMVLGAAGMMTRYPPRVVALGLAVAFASLIGAMLAANPQAALASPSLVVTPVALTGAVTMMCWAMMKSERSQRADAIVDPLTGLLNRKALASRAVAAAYHASMADAPVSLLICDLDHFKRINDEHGHAVGDAVLRDAAYALRSQLRTFDGAFRIGGEEFAMLLPEVESAAAHVLAERLRHAVEEARPAGITVTVSIGVATLRGEAVTLERLLRQCDTALYTSKRGGRNRVSVAQPDAGEEATTLVAELADAEGDPGAGTTTVRTRERSILA